MSPCPFCFFGPGSRILMQRPGEYKKAMYSRLNRKRISVHRINMGSCCFLSGRVYFTLCKACSVALALQSIHCKMAACRVKTSGALAISVFKNFVQPCHTRRISTCVISNLPAVQEPLSRPESQIKCTLVPGDGVGPELCAAVREVFSAVSVPIKFEELFLSEIHQTMSVPIEIVVESIKRNGIALKGALQSPPFTRYSGELQTLNMKMRRDLDMFANVVHIRSLPGVKTRHSNLDFVIIREQTEGEYSALEHECVHGVVECMKIITRAKSERIAKFAFDYATRHGRKKVTAIHKANIMKLGDGLFLRTCEKISELYPQIEFENMIIDNACMQLVANPHKFDVMVMPNLYGSIIDNVASGLVGGAGVVPGASYSADSVIYEPGARHTFGEAVGKNIANPTAMLLCASKMLRHVNLPYYASLVQDATEKVLKTGKIRTRDLGGYASTTDFTLAVIENLPH